MSQTMNEIRLVEGGLVVPHGARFGILATRFNDFLVGKLVEGAIDAIVRHGGDRDLITVVKVPGAWELPLVARTMAKTKRFDAIVAVGAVIRGSTPHFEYVAGEAAKGLSQVQLGSEIPIGFGVLTTDTIEQAVERSGTKAGNKGFEAAMAAIEIVSLMGALNPQTDRLLAAADASPPGARKKRGN